MALTLHLNPSENVLSGLSPDAAATDRALVRRWTDTVAGAVFDQTDSSNRPQFGQVIGSGNPGLLFDTNDMMSSSVQLSSIITASAFEVAIAFRASKITLSEANVWTNHAIFCDEGGFFGFFVRLNADVPTLTAFVWDGAAKSLSVPITPGEAHTAWFRLAGGSIFLSLDHAAEITTASGTVATTTGVLSLGKRVANPLGTSYYNGQLFEVLAYNAAFSPEDRAVAQAALHAKYTPTRAGYDWTRLLLQSGGRLDSLADLGDGVLLSATRSPNGAKLFRSLDDGETWSSAGTIGTADLTTIAESGSDGLTAYMTDEESVVYKTEDAGDNWDSLGQLSTGTKIGSFARCYGLIVTEAGTVLVATMEDPNGHIFRSTDGGDNFTDLGAFNVLGIYRFVLTENGILANTTSGKTMRSTDDGVTWTVSAAWTDQPLWAICYAGDEVCVIADQAGAIYRSTDDGVTFEHIVTVDGGADDFALLDTTLVYSTYTSRRWYYRSDDLGLNWYVGGTTPTIADDSLEHIIAVGNRFIAVTNKGYALRSNEAGNAIFPSAGLGNRIVLVGTEYPITWQSVGTSGTVNILLSLDGGTTFPITVESALMDLESYDWTPTVGQVGSNAVLRIEDAGDGSIYGDITGLTIATTTPGSGGGSVVNSIEDYTVMYVPKSTAELRTMIRLPGDPIDIAFDNTDLSIAYRVEGQATFTALTLVAGTIGTYLSSSFVREAVGSARYQVCWPAAAVVSGSKTTVRITYDGVTEYGRIDAVLTDEVTPTDAAMFADVARRRTQANVETSDYGDALSIGSLYGLIQQAQESNTEDNAGNLTVYRTDGTTELAQKPIATDGTAEPVVGIS